MTNKNMSSKQKPAIPFYIWTFSAIAGYIVFFLVFYSLIGESLAIFAFVPPLVVAWIGGIRRGVVAAFLSDVCTLTLLHFEGVKTWDVASIIHRSPGLISVLLIAVIVGYLSSLRKRLDQELDEKNKIEKELRESEDRFKSIYEGSNDALMLLNEKGFFDCNAKTLEMFGFKSKEEFARVHPADISPPKQPDGQESFPAAQKRIGKAFETGSNRFDWVHRKTNGEDFPAEVLLSAFDLNGKRVLQATVRDISKRKKAEELLAQTEKSFRSMFELTSEGASLIRPITNRFVAANPAMSALFGYTEEEFLTLTAEDITPTEAKDIMRNSLKLLSDGGDVPDHEGTSLKKDGTKVNVIVCCRQLLWKNERVFYVTFKDVTYLKDVQKRLEKKNQEILEFTNAATHDLKKPLTTMKTVCSLMQTGALGNLTDEGKEAMCMGAEGISYMQELLDDLLASAKLDAGVQELALEEIDLRALAQDVVARLKFQIEEKKVSVAINDELGMITADRKGMTKVFMNLIGNAVSYIGDGPDRKIVIGAKKTDGKKVYYVRDNGMGIPEESQKTLFQKFKRGANVKGISGTGLGLSIVKGTIEAHGGTIWAESKIGDGTTFYFTLEKTSHR